MYKAGQACSECPLGTSCSSDFPGLCVAPKNSTSSASPKNAPAPVNTIRTSKPKARPPVRTTAKPRRTTTQRTTTTTRRVTTRPTTTVRTRVEPTTTRNSKPKRKPGQPLFSCAFEPSEKSCKNRLRMHLLPARVLNWCFSRNIGEPWTSNQVFGNQHHELVLKAGDKSEFFFKQLIEPPTGGIACLDFRYKKISSGAQFYHFILGLSLHSHCRRLQLSVDSVCLASKRLIVVENNIKN